MDGWYIEAAPKHYRCHTIYITKTRSEHIARTVEFFPHDIDMPAKLATDNTTAAARMLTEALSNPTNEYNWTIKWRQNVWVVQSQIF